MKLLSLYSNSKKFSGNIIHRMLLSSIEDQLNLPDDMRTEEKLFCIDYNYRWDKEYLNLTEDLDGEISLPRHTQQTISLVENTVHPDVRSTMEFNGFLAGIRGLVPQNDSNERYMVGYSRGKEYVDVVPTAERDGRLIVREYTDLEKIDIF